MINYLLQPQPSNLIVISDHECHRVEIPAGMPNLLHHSQLQRPSLRQRPPDLSEVFLKSGDQTVSSVQVPVRRSSAQEPGLGVHHRARWLGPGLSLAGLLGRVREKGSHCSPGELRPSPRQDQGRILSVHRVPETPSHQRPRQPPEEPPPRELHDLGHFKISN